MLIDTIRTLWSRDEPLLVRAGLAVLGLCMAATLGLLGYALFELANTQGLNARNEATTVVTGKEIVSPSIIVIVTGVGPQLYPVNGSLHVQFALEGVVVNPAVTEEFFTAVSPGQRLRVRYGYGRITGKPVPLELHIQSE